MFVLFQITQTQIQDFKKDLEKFSEKFYDFGPGAVGTDLEKGRWKFFLSFIPDHSLNYMYFNDLLNENLLQVLS